MKLLENFKIGQLNRVILQHHQKINKIKIIKENWDLINLSLPDLEGWADEVEGGEDKVEGGAEVDAGADEVDAGADEVDAGADKVAKSRLCRLSFLAFPFVAFGILKIDCQTFSVLKIDCQTFSEVTDFFLF